MSVRRSLALVAGSLAAVLSAAVPAAADPPDTLAAQRQKLVGGTLVDVATQQALGLVTVRAGGGCSGTLLNRFWVLTAAHCVGATAEDTQVSAAWQPDQVHRGTRLVRYDASHDLDVALIYLGATNFGETPTQPIRATAPSADDRVEAFGRGIFQFAVPPRTPSQSDGRYRTARFDVTSVGDTVITLPGGNPSISGGDSGGPDWLLDGSGQRVAIVGVHSSAVRSGCVPMRVCNRADPWTWATGVSSSNTARTDTIATDIRTRIREFPCRLRPAACNTPVFANLVIMK